ncbi:hypothetical protein QR680_014264 [Steinernema hermaphroditum]|uniref:Tudor domain-containing protein n=1 Tax=Steinernema hermaphroditum TaxID=289476 RepID=A0AA39IAX1_9BILA|nr:hypothetical protein QR680_014264 [Steinernema hermaphroditum]
MSGIAFQRNANGTIDEDEQSEVWDDSELVKMYDRGLAELYAMADHEKTGSPSPQPQEEEVAETAKATKTWKKGDKCLAFFKGDELYYPAEIVDEKKRQGYRVLYKVRYTEFDKRDPMSYAEVSADEIMSETDSTAEVVPEAAVEQPEKPKKSGGDKMQRHGISASPTPSTAEGADARKSIKQSAKSADPNLNPNVQSLLQSFAPKTVAQAAPVNTKTVFSSSSTPSLASVIPRSMPFPPFLFNGLGPNSTEEALSNYIMSTYMNGYHSGYYQALKDMEEKAKKETK